LIGAALVLDICPRIAPPPKEADDARKTDYSAPRGSSERRPRGAACALGARASSPALPLGGFRSRIPVDSRARGLRVAVPARLNMWVPSSSDTPATGPWLRRTDTAGAWLVESGSGRGRPRSQGVVGEEAKGRGVRAGSAGVLARSAPGRVSISNTCGLPRLRPPGNRPRAPTTCGCRRRVIPLLRDPDYAGRILLGRGWSRAGAGEDARAPRGDLEYLAGERHGCSEERKQTRRAEGGDVERPGTDRRPS
jgi:hypothetical protein